MKKVNYLLGAAIAAGVVASAVNRRRRRFELSGKTVLITGGSRGLGLLLAHEFAARGARIAIIARDPEELDRAAAQLRAAHYEVLTITADVTMREEAEGAIKKAQQTLGPIDVLVNNAGIISVGPLETTAIDDFRDSLNTHFWGPYFTAMAVLPHMRRRRSGRIVNISSIGGKISVPHLLPYCTGKFALTGFSEGLRSALLKDKIYVTTVCPGLIRTGSPRNALFKGNNEAEYAWFSISDALPITSMSAERGARQIVDACVHGDAELVLSPQARVAVKVHGLFTSTVTDLMGVVNRLLPAAPGGERGKEARTGEQSFSKVSPSPITVLNEAAAERNNQIA